MQKPTRIAEISTKVTARVTLLYSPCSPSPDLSQPLPHWLRLYPVLSSFSILSLPVTLACQVVITEWVRHSSYLFIRPVTGQLLITPVLMHFHLKMHVTIY